MFEAEDNELIDGLTFDEWMDMIPVGLEKMSEAEKEEAHREADIRIAQIREKRTSDELWRAKVYGKKDGYYPPPAVPNYEHMRVASPSKALYYSQEPTGTPEQDEILMRGVDYRKAGGKMLTKEEFFANMRAAIELGASRARL